MTDNQLSVNDSKKVVYIVLLIISVYIYFESIILKKQFIIIDVINLIIHESGHFFFMNSRGIIGPLSGTLAQILFPIFLSFLAFYYKDKIIGIFFLFWSGENLIDISYYIADAKDMKLDMIIPNGTHDWNYMLGKFNLIEHCKTIADLVYLLGFIIMTATFLLCLYFTIKFFKEN
jgi:hypothetical protein